MEESQNTEFKASLADINGILKGIVAFANDGGGEILVGIDDSGKLLGISVGRNTLENLAIAISKNIDPPVMPQIYLDRIQEKTILRIKINESNVKPHFYKGMAYQRVGRTNLSLTPAEIEQMIRSRIKIPDFDEQMSEATIANIDEKAFEIFVRLVKDQKRVDVAHLTKKEILEKLDLISGKKLKNAAVILFCTDPGRFFPFYSFKCAVSKTSAFELEQLIDIQNLEKPFFIVVQELVDYIVRYLPKKIYLEGMIRKEEPIISETALREVVVNALIHRDYEIPSPNYLLITPEFLEIKNPGGLPKGIRVPDLYKLHNSILRNDLMAKVVYYTGYTDKWGSGTTKIITECGRNLILPQFINESMFFAVRIPFKAPEEAVRVINLLKEERKGAKQIGKELKISERGARKLLSSLVEKQLIQRTRAGTHIYYELYRH